MVAGSDGCAWQQVSSDFAVELQCCIIPWQQPCWAAGMKQASVGVAAHRTRNANNTNAPLLPTCMVYSLGSSLLFTAGQFSNSDPNHTIQIEARLFACKCAQPAAPESSYATLMFRWNLLKIKVNRILDRAPTAPLKPQTGSPLQRRIILTIQFQQGMPGQSPPAGRSVQDILAAPYALAACLRIAEVARNCMKERLGNFRGSHSPMENLIKRVCTTINLVGVFSVLAH